MITERRCNPVVLTEKFARNERRTTVVVVLTLVMMVVELVVGSMTRSLALVADGWHMATHAGALGLAVLAYWYARTRARSHAFTFGTGKVHALAGYTSAALLGVAAVFIIGESISRFVNPAEVASGEALIVAGIGLAFNLVCAWLLDEDHGHDHHHDHDHPHEHAHDHNLRAARLHVLADALTSVMAIAALSSVRWLHWTWADPVAALIGGVVILRWGWTLCKSTALQLLDASWSPETAGKLQAALEETGAQVTDLHLWELGPGQRGLIVHLCTPVPLPLAAYRAKIASVAAFSHVTVEIEPALVPA